MCVIAVAQKRKLTDEELSQMWAANPSGGGVGWLERRNGQVLSCYKKGFTKLKDLKAFYKGITAFPHVVHFRIPSSGGGDAILTHPFIVSADSPLALEHKGTEDLLFHNGTFSGYGAHATAMAATTGNPIEGKVNDSRVIAIIRHWVPEYIQNIVASSYSRFAILSPKSGKKKGKAKGKVTLYGEFTEIDGIHVSNEYWKSRDLKEWAKSTLNSRAFGGGRSATVDAAITSWEQRAFPSGFGVGPTRTENTAPTAEDWEGSRLVGTQGIGRVKARYRSPWIKAGVGVVHGD